METRRRLLRHPGPAVGAAGAVTLDVRSVALVILALSAAMAVLHWAQAVFVPIVVSLLISYALEPIVRRLTRMRVPRIVAAAVVTAVLAGALGYTGYALADDAAAIVARLPDAAAQLRQAVRQGRSEPSPIQQVQRAAEELQRAADEAAGAINPAARGVLRVQIEEPAINVRKYLTWGSASAVVFAAQAVLVILFAFFLLASGDLFKRKLVKLAESSREKNVTVAILDDINLQIERFLLILLFSSVIVGGATWIMFRAVGLEQAAVWAIAAGVFNSIPYLVR